MTRLIDIVDLKDLQRGRDEKFISVQTSHDGQRIYNYTDSALFTPGSWDNPAVRACRGLITAPDGTVVARPWAKFFNHGQAEAGALDLAAPVEVTDKMDGSLGIIHLDQIGNPRVATRGSFQSPQAVHATAWLQAQGWDLRIDPNVTPLVEIIFPGNRIVCDYGDEDSLVLLGGVDIPSGRYYGPWEMSVMLRWPGKRTTIFEYETLADALAAPPRPGAEGLCVRYKDDRSDSGARVSAPGRIVKIKQDDYVQMHRVITNCSARVLWTHMAVDACRHAIQEPQHWGSYLGMDPLDAERSMSLVDTHGDWRTAYLTGLPDEFIAWVDQTTEQIRTTVNETLERGRGWVNRLKGLPHREQFALLGGADPMEKEILRVVRSGDETPLLLRAWHETYPDGFDKPFAQNEATA